MIGGRNIDAKGAVIGEHRQVIAPLRDEHFDAHAEKTCRFLFVDAGASASNRAQPVPRCLFPPTGYTSHGRLWRTR